MKTTFTPDHPVVFVFDYDNEAMLVPELDDQAVVSANESALSVRTIADVDGDVTVELTNSTPKEATNSVEVFRGRINTPSGKLAVVTSRNEKLIEVPIRGAVANVVVAVDDTKFPSTVWIAAR